MCLSQPAPAPKTVLWISSQTHAHWCHLDTASGSHTMGAFMAWSWQMRKSSPSPSLESQSLNIYQYKLLGDGEVSRYLYLVFVPWWVVSPMPSQASNPISNSQKDLVSQQPKREWVDVFNQSIPFPIVLTWISSFLLREEFIRKTENAEILCYLLSRHHGDTNIIMLVSLAHMTLFMVGPLSWQMAWLMVDNTLSQWHG